MPSTGFLVFGVISGYVLFFSSLLAEITNPRLAWLPLVTLLYFPGLTAVFMLLDGELPMRRKIGIVLYGAACMLPALMYRVLAH